MKVSINYIENKELEQVIIDCVELTREVMDIKSFVLGRGTVLAGVYKEHIYQVNLQNIFYFEVVDEHVFAYTLDQVYEVKARLYELEDAYHDRNFVRCSKSFILNLMKLESISPALNGRFMAHMKNGEKIIISRQYVPNIKKMVMGGKK